MNAQFNANFARIFGAEYSATVDGNGVRYNGRTLRVAALSLDFEASVDSRPIGTYRTAESAYEAAKLHVDRQLA